MTPKVDIISVEDLKNIQLKILCSVDNFCRTNKLNYSLAFGSLLGAVRHKGFIPWDDDIDILMPRKDYDIFIKSFKDIGYYVITHQTCNRYILPYAKVCFDQSIFIDAFMPNLKIGVNIDVFPVDKITDNIVLRKKYIIRRKLWNSLFLLKNLDLKWRGIIKTFLILTFKCILFPISKEYICNKLISLSIEFNNCNCLSAGILAPADFNEKKICECEVFKHYIEMPFEGNRFFCVRDYDKYLKRLYGDYMQMPPKDKQVSHHRFKAYWI